MRLRTCIAAVHEPLDLDIGLGSTSLRRVDRWPGAPKQTAPPCDPGGFAWEIVRRRTDYRPSEGTIEGVRIGQDPYSVERLTGTLPDPLWGLQFRRGPGRPRRQRLPLLASRSRPAGDRRPCGTRHAWRPRRLRPVCAAGSGHAPLARTSRGTLAAGPRPPRDPSQHCARHVAR